MVTNQNSRAQLRFPKNADLHAIRAIEERRRVLAEMELRARKPQIMAARARELNETERAAVGVWDKVYHESHFGSRVQRVNGEDAKKQAFLDGLKEAGLDTSTVIGELRRAIYYPGRGVMVNLPPNLVGFFKRNFGDKDFKE